MNVNRSALKYRGIHYDVGVPYEPGMSSRPQLSDETMRREIAVIHEELHCNTIIIHGSDNARIVSCAAYAAEQDLYVWVQPRLIDTGADDVLDNLRDLAVETEHLRRDYGRVGLNVGCEISLFTSGFIPGENYTERMARLSDDAIIDHGAPFSAFLEKTQNVTRERFAGPLTYAAGPWEWNRIDWSGFDFVGIDHYLNVAEKAEYVRTIRTLTRRQKPLLVTEFGTCTFEGAQYLGGMGWSIVDYSGTRATVPTDIERSERVQADAIGAALDIFEAEGVAGAFVFTFIEPTQTHSVDRRLDLDAASYGVVKARVPHTERSASLWEPKLAFHDIARRFARYTAHS